MWKFSIKMAGNLQQRLDSLRGKAQLLTERYAKLLEQKRVLEEQIAQFNATIERQQKEMAVMRQQIEYLQVVSVIAPKREDVERSRAFLAGLVRDIDKCINELNE